ncbi:TPA: hypothetical protein TY426_001255 [Streptococcus suis]|nr:hypothetical protein [Streptococcus suis]
MDILLSKKIEKLVLSAGVNDLIAGYPMSETIENLSKIVESLQKQNIEVYITTIAYSLFRDSVSNDAISMLNHSVEKVAERFSVPLIDVNAVVSKDNFLQYKYTRDGLHFNDQGQEKVNQYIIEAVQGL